MVARTIGRVALGKFATAGVAGFAGLGVQARVAARITTTYCRSNGWRPLPRRSAALSAAGSAYFVMRRTERARAIAGSFSDRLRAGVPGLTQEDITPGGSFTYREPGAGCRDVPVPSVSRPAARARSIRAVHHRCARRLGRAVVPGANPCQWMLHCHNAHHLDAGMATILSYRGS